MQKLLLILAVVLVACSQPSGASLSSGTSSAVRSMSVEAGASGVAEGVLLPGESPIPGRFTAPPLTPETRTPTELAQAACRGRDGLWRCSGVKPEVKFATVGTVSSAIMPTSWTVSSWAIDPQNSTGCASDSNNGTSLTCGAVGSGVGPLATYQELLVHRWGCLGSPDACPRIRQFTTITFLSSHTDNTDPVYFRAGTENGAYVVFSGGALTVASTGTLASVTAKNRPSNTFPFQADFGAAQTPGRLGSCTHVGSTGNFWFYTNTAGTVYTTSQPLTTCTTAQIPFGCSNTYVDTCTNGDSFTAYNALPNVNIVQFEPTQTDFDGSQNYSGLYHINIFDPNGLAHSPVWFGALTAMVESSSQRLLRVRAQSGSGGFQFAEWMGANSNFFGGFMAAGPQPKSNNNANLSVETVFFRGGVVGGPSCFFDAINGGFFSFDAIVPGCGGLGSTAYLYNSTNTGYMMIPTGSTLVGSGDFKVAAGTYAYYGGGSINLIGPSRATYAAGVGAAGVVYPLSGGLQVNGQTKTCIAVPGAGAIGACNTTLSAANLDANLGATSGCLFAPGGAAFCNYGP